MTPRIRARIEPHPPEPWRTRTCYAYLDHFLPLASVWVSCTRDEALAILDYAREREVPQ